MLDFETDEPFRSSVRTFIKANLPAEIARSGRQGWRPLAADVRRWTATLDRQGWSAPSWPKEYGGPGWSVRQQHLFEIESLRAGALPPSPQGLYLVGPIIYTFGSPEQKRRFLPLIRSGAHLWAQGFSEPNAGSDLGSLRTRAVRNGDHYVVNGQKIWTSDAAESDWLFLLARTSGPGESGSGISFLLVDLKTPGITVRPIHSIDNGRHLTEVFLEDVSVPVDNLLGEEGAGWTYAKFLLNLERASSAVAPLCVVAIEHLESHVASTSRLARDAALAWRIAELRIDLMAHEVSTMRVAAEQESGRQSASLAASTLKIRGSELLQRIGALGVELLGANALRAFDRDAAATSPPYMPPAPEAVGGAVADFMYRRAATIYGGANEIQRNILGKALLRS